MEKTLIVNIMSDIKKFIKKRDLECVEVLITKNLDDFISIKKDVNFPKNNEESLQRFLEAKRLEGCSESTISYYSMILKKMLSEPTKIYFNITTEDIRTFLDTYKVTKKISNVTVNNVRRIISSFFSWLEDEEFIVKSPVRRIHKVKVPKIIKDIYSDDDIENFRNATTCQRDLAIIDLFVSTGIRVGELTKLKINDLDLENQECVVTGKGNKQRRVYFDSRTKIDIRKYLKSRNDNSDYLFVTIFNPHKRLEISGVEIMIRKLGEKINISKAHPHKFRRTLATKAIDKGMPIEQVQHLLGHTKIDTTLEYAMVDEENVKRSHKKYLE